MYTYQLQPRSFRVYGDRPPELPAEVEIVLTMEPGAALGASPGPLDIVLLGSGLRFEYNANTGRINNFQDPPLAPVGVSHSVLGGSLRTQNAQLVFRFPCPSLEVLVGTLETLRLTLPAILSLFLPEALYASEAVAHVGTVQLRSQVARAVTPIAVRTQESYAQLVRDAFHAVGLLLEARNRALLAAVQYVHVAQRLARAGYSPWEFTAEVLLNLTKALEALFGGSRDAIREGTRALGYPDAEVEGIFVSLRILRDELDVGHAKVLDYDEQALQAIYSFVLEAPIAVAELVQRAVRLTRDGEWCPRPLANTIDTAELRALERLLQSMKRGQDARRARAASRTVGSTGPDMNSREHG